MYELEFQTKCTNQLQNHKKNLECKNFNFFFLALFLYIYVNLNSNTPNKIN
jgi:hypothetical protein